MLKKKEKIHIGWKEYISFVDWEIEHVLAKIDTGARTSSVHVEHLREISDHQIEFMVSLDAKATPIKKRIVAQYHRKGHVRSSIGKSAIRYFVQTRIQIGNIVKMIELNLVNRNHMNYRMLLGRSVLQKNFIVDVSHTFMLSKKLKRLV